MKSKMGRSTKFNQEIIKELSYRAHILDDLFLTIKDICKFLKISRDTYYRWKREYPEFRYQDKLLLESQQERALAKMVEGVPITNKMKVFFT